MSNTNELKSFSRVLTHMGYAIRKDSLTPEETQNLRTELTVAPKLQVQRQFAKAPEPFTIFQESPSRFYCPRIWAREKFGEPEATILTDGDDIRGASQKEAPGQEKELGLSHREDLKFVGKPYDYQEEIVNKFVESGSNGLICVPCGRGKTFMAIACAARLGKKFIIIVDKEFLLQQWAGELQALMPGIRIGILQADKKEIDSRLVITPEPSLPELKEMCRERKLKVGGNKTELQARLKEVGVDTSAKKEIVELDCCIAMIQTLVQQEFEETEFRCFGFGIFDECHHLGASNFSRALLKVQPKCMLGLSATPTRDDGLTKVFEWFIGKPIYWEKTREADPDVVVRKVSFHTDDNKYSEVPVDRRGEMVLARLLTQVVECEERSKFIDRVLEELVKDSRRRILVLSERKAHLERIEAGIPKGVTFSYYIGGMKEEIREEGAKTAQVLLGTYSMASEAMNIKTLNTMVMASPRKKIEQSTGRILRTRKDEREVQPIIVDIVDSHDVYQGQWMKRKAYYKKCAYGIQIPTDDSLTQWKEDRKEKKDKKQVKMEEVKECLILDD
jgi:superfamily II DNA or RNA helicase